ncbi:MAG: 16S rRNA (adenine(1518)-N(6)/adenine(1519)-N(6))-dimethyltransferase RsmA [Synechococcus lacustris]
MGFSGHTARKRFGQHWLKDASVLDRIAAAAELEPGDTLLEIGPGRGALTERLLKSPIEQLHAVELDRDLVQGLRQQFGHDQRFLLLEGDALAIPLPPARKVVANIPYNITGPLLERLLGRLDRPSSHRYERLVLLLQKEVADRITAPAGHSSFSGLSVRLQLQAECESICSVPPRCFQPPPKVMSEVICLRPRAESLEPELAKKLESLLKRCFGARRKMLRNTLAGLLAPEALEAWASGAGVRLEQRPQELAPERWLALAAGLPPSP